VIFFVTTSLVVRNVQQKVGERGGACTGQQTALKAWSQNLKK